MEILFIVDTLLLAERITQQNDEKAKEKKKIEKEKKRSVLMITY